MIFSLSVVSSAATKRPRLLGSVPVALLHRCAAADVLIAELKAARAVLEPVGRGTYSCRFDVPKGEWIIWPDARSALWVGGRDDQLPPTVRDHLFDDDLGNRPMIRLVERLSLAGVWVREAALLIKDQWTRPYRADGALQALSNPAAAALSEAFLQDPVGAHKSCLCSVGPSSASEWEWTGVLVYDHQYRLRTGEYVTSRPHVVFHVRSDNHPTRAHILVEIRHASDFEQVHRYLAQLLPTSDRWSIIPFTLLDDEARHDEIRALVGALGAGGEVKVAHPNTQRVRARTTETDVGEFVRHMREARYSTNIQGLQSLIERAEHVDHSVLSAFDLYHWDGKARNAVAVRVRLKQHGTDPLTIEWGSAREPRTAAGVPLPAKLVLDTDGWETMTAVSWSEDECMMHLHKLWLRLITATEEAARVVAA
jgi:hypothetical protein